MSIFIRIVFSMRWPWMPVASTTPLGWDWPVEGISSVSVTVKGGLVVAQLTPARVNRAPEQFAGAVQARTPEGSSDARIKSEILKEWKKKNSSNASRPIPRSWSDSPSSEAHA